MRATAARSPAAASAARTACRVIGNLLLGAALGILSYWSLTGLVADQAQGRLRIELGGVASTALPAVTGGPVMDFSDWASTDQVWFARAAEGSAVGRLVIPRIGLDSVVVKGTSDRDLREGPGWIATTSPPGPQGNTGISGHRVTFARPFRRLDEVAPGDWLDFYSPYRRYRYRTTGRSVVTPDRVDVLAYNREPVLTLTACHPPYSARYRLILHAKLVEVRRLKDAAPPAASP